LASRRLKRSKEQVREGGGTEIFNSQESNEVGPNGKKEQGELISSLAGAPKIKKILVTELLESERLGTGGGSREEVWRRGYNSGGFRDLRAKFYFGGVFVRGGFGGGVGEEGKWLG